MNHTTNSLKQRQSNARAAAAKKRAATHCARGHSKWGFRKDGRRYCVTCKVERNRKWRKERGNHRPRVLLTPVGIRRALSYDERQILRQKISEIQREREFNVRRMWIIDANGDKLSLGGGSRPWYEQTRSGYPSSQAA